jgi:hypothetical protein
MSSSTNASSTLAMNCSSNRGRLEEIHRIDSHDCAQTCLKLNSSQTYPVRERRENSSPRSCPKCGSPLQVVNQRDLLEWEHQPLKIDCTNKDCPGYLHPIDERAPFSEIPRCSVDRKTKYRLAERGKGKLWPCPKHLVSVKSSKRIGRTYCALYATTSPAVI